MRVKSTRNLLKQNAEINQLCNKHCTLVELALTVLSAPHFFVKMEFAKENKTDNRVQCMEIVIMNCFVTNQQNFHIYQHARDRELLMNLVKILSSVRTIFTAGTLLKETQQRSVFQCIHNLLSLGLVGGHQVPKHLLMKTSN